MEAGEHVAVHETGGVAEHLAPLDARLAQQRSRSGVEAFDEVRRRLGPDPLVHVEQA